MSKVLVAYFSVSGVTAKVAKELADMEKADLFEIRPEADQQPFTGHAGDDIIIHARSESSIKKEHEQHDV